MLAQGAKLALNGALIGGAAYATRAALAASPIGRFQLRPCWLNSFLRCHGCTLDFTIRLAGLCLWLDESLGLNCSV